MKVVLTWVYGSPREIRTLVSGSRARHNDSDSQIECNSRLFESVDNRRLDNPESTIARFYEYCSVDERLEHRVARDYKLIAIRFLKFSGGIVSRESIRAYLQSYLNRAPKTYNNQLCGLRAFIERFLGLPELMKGFKKAHEGNNHNEIELPSREQIKKGFEGLTEDRERAIYLLYASSGLRQLEARLLNRFTDIDYQLKAIKSRHDTRTKKAGITFFNEECELWLKRYLASRKDNSERLFAISNYAFYLLWKKASKNAGIKISPQILRKWHSTELGELGVPDRYVDVFQGRAPKNVLAKFYTGKELERLKRIYNKAGLKVLS